MPSIYKSLNGLGPKHIPEFFATVSIQQSDSTGLPTVKLPVATIYSFYSKGLDLSKAGKVQLKLITLMMVASHLYEQVSGL